MSKRTEKTETQTTLEETMPLNTETMPVTEKEAGSTARTRNYYVYLQDLQTEEQKEQNVMPESQILVSGLTNEKDALMWIRQCAEVGKTYHVGYSIYSRSVSITQTVKFTIS